MMNEQKNVQRTGQDGAARRRDTAEALAFAAVVLAAGAAVAGLFVPGLYRDLPGWAQQAQGADLSTAALAVPLFAVALRAGRRGAIEAELLVLGVLVYLAYTYAVAGFSVAINPLTVVYIAVLGLSVWSLLVWASALDTHAAERLVEDRLPRWTAGMFLLVVAALFGLLWLGQLGTVALTGTPPDELVRLGLPTNPIYALDLAFFLPACVVAGIAVLRRQTTRFIAPILIVFAALMGAEIVGGFLFAARAGEEVALPVALVIGSVTSAAGALALVSLRLARPLGAPTRANRPREPAIRTAPNTGGARRMSACRSSVPTEPVRPWRLDSPEDVMDR
jgi:hypothetical protein